MTPALLLAFMAAVTVLTVIPGPNVALIVANSVAHGPRYGLLTVGGTSAAMVFQLALTAFGMTELLGTVGIWFGWLRWVGVVYLIYLGVQQWRAPPADLAGIPASPGSARGIFVRALLVSLTNPKTLLFYGAFFPQFVVPDGHAGRQVFVLSVIFLGIALAVDSGWALAAGRARGALLARGRLYHRLSGGALIGAGTALALARPK